VSSVFVYCKYKVVYFINQIFGVKFFVVVGDYIFKIVWRIKKGRTFLVLP